MKDEYIVRFYNEVKSFMDGDYKIILEPNRSLKEDWIEYDSVKWEMSDELNELVDNLKKDNTKSFEEKVLAVYQYICLKYVYDANVLYFFRKDISDPNNIKYIFCKIVLDSIKINRETTSDTKLLNISNLNIKLIKTNIAP